MGVEQHDREELTRARAVLERQEEILRVHFPADSSWARALMVKLANQIREIDELLEAEGASDA